MVLEWMDPRPAYSRIDLLCCSISLHMGDSEPPVSLVLVSFTLIYRAACPLLVTLHDQSFSHI